LFPALFIQRHSVSASLKSVLRHYSFSGCQVIVSTREGDVKAETKSYQGCVGCLIITTIRKCFVQISNWSVPPNLALTFSLPNLLLTLGQLAALSCLFQSSCIEFRDVLIFYFFSDFAPGKKQGWRQSHRMTHRVARCLWRHLSQALERCWNSILSTEEMKPVRVVRCRMSLSRPSRRCMPRNFRKPRQSA
jgi:hypothetical protein